MNRMSVAFGVLAALLLLQPAHTCSFNQPLPWEEKAPHLDPDGEPRRNFQYLLNDYLVPAPPRSYPPVKPYDAYVNSARELVGASGRAIGVNLEPHDLRHGPCLGNTIETARSIRRTQRALELSAPVDAAAMEALAYVTNKTERICGHLLSKRYVSSDLLNSSVATVRDFAWPDAWIENTWLVLARYYIYAHATDAAGIYIAKLASSESQEMRTWAARLEDIIAQQTPLPLLVNLEKGRRYFASCGTNNPANTLTYFRHVLAAPIADELVVDLMHARDQLRGRGCRSGDDLPALTEFEQRQPDNAVAVEYAHYLRAALSFYEADYETALKQFDALSGGRDDWLAETALYMKVRVNLVMSQRDWNGYSPPAETVDNDMVETARRAIDEYLETYPAGRYADSARGLLRRAAYLTGDRESLNAMVGEKLYAAEARLLLDKTYENSAAFVALFNEWRQYTDRKVDYGAASALTIALDLVYAADNFDQRLDQLRAHRTAFENHRDLFELLQSFLLYKAGHYDQIPLDSAQSLFASQVQLGIGAVQARASVARGDHLGARQVWMAMHLSAPERRTWALLNVGIAASYTKLGQYREMSQTGSHVESRQFFELAFRGICDIDTLVDITNDPGAHAYARDAARNEVFSRRLLAQEFDETVALYRKIDDPGDFSLIETAVRTLAANPDDPKGMLNVGHYLMTRLKPPSIPHINVFYPPPESLADCPTVMIGKRFYGPLEYLGRVIAHHGDAVYSKEDAKALHFLVRCGKHGSAGGGCRWGRYDVALPDGRQAFRRLHSKYPDSVWAEKTPYHYHRD